MRMLPPIIALIIVALIANCAFVVREGQSALLLQLGRIEGVGSQAGADYKPGLHFKLPLIQQVVNYDRRVLNLEAAPERYFTNEKKAVTVDFYVKWRIENAVTYYQSFGADEFQSLANQRLAPIIKDSLRFEFSARTTSPSRCSSRSTSRPWTRSASTSSTCA